MRIRSSTFGHYHHGRYHYYAVTAEGMSDPEWALYLKEMKAKTLTALQQKGNNHEPVGALSMGNGVY